MPWLPAIILGGCREKIKSNYIGVNSKKDQSYFLFSTTQEQVDFLRFPLGGMSKSETRGIANKFNLKVADKPDSQDICFVPNGNYAEIIKKLRLRRG